MSTTPPTSKPRRRRLRVAAFVPAGIVATALLASACTPATGTTQRVSTTSTGVPFDATSFAGRLSRDGRFVAMSTESQLVAPFPTTQVVRKDRTTGATIVVSIRPDGQMFLGRNIAQDITADGTKIAFTNIVRDGLNDVETAWVRNLTTGTTVPVATTLSGGFSTSQDPDISGDGRFVAFRSSSPSLVTGDTNNRSDVFVRDLGAGTIRRVSLSFGGNRIPAGADLPRISDDGRFVVFRTTQNLVGEDTDDNEDVYVRDTVGGITTFESLAGVRTFARSADISGDGRFVAFRGESGPGVQAQAWVRDRVTRSVTLISHKDGSATQESNNLAFDIDISEDGRHVAFTSVANDLVAGDTNSELDVFLSSSAGGPITRLSLRPGGQQTNRANLGGQVADGGKIVLFQSDDAALVSGDTNAATDVFVRLV